jgi:hypothetical protein
VISANENSNKFQKTGWSEPAATNARVEDEAVETVLGMNQKHILPCPKLLIFSASSLPQKISLLPYLPPTNLPPPPPSLPQPTSHDFALTPPLKLGSYWSMNKAREQLEREHSHNNMLEASPRTPS